MFSDRISVHITREWVQMIEPLKDDPEKWYLFFRVCVDAASGRIKNFTGFEDEHLDRLYQRTRIKPGNISVNHRRK